MKDYSCEYKRLVSYIFAYPDGCRDCSVGFAKVMLRKGIFSINVSLTNLYRDTPEGAEVFLLFERGKENHKSGKKEYYLLPIGSFVINCGRGGYQDIFNPSDIESSGYEFDEIKGIAVIPKGDDYYSCFSLWEADDIDVTRCMRLPKGYKKSDFVCDGAINVDAGQSDGEAMTEDDTEECSDMSFEQSEEICKDCGKRSEEADDTFVENNTEECSDKSSEQNKEICKDCGERCEQGDDTFVENDEKVGLSIFDDDYYYDFMEVTPQTLDNLVDGEALADNSFVMHGFYKYRHLLFGRVTQNVNGTRYFVGVPGMYSNKERQFAMMFGFNNFKKSHRSDYPNPYFGYWYMEV